MTFGSTEHAWALIVLAWIVLLASIQSAQMCHIQGTRRIADLAHLKIVGAVGGAAIGIGFYAWLRLDGIVPALVTLAAFELAASWWYARKVPARRTPHELEGIGPNVGRISSPWSSLHVVRPARQQR